MIMHESTYTYEELINVAEWYTREEEESYED